MTHRTLFPPPDENRALEQLERLHREIQRARRNRERAGAEFEGFVHDRRPDVELAGASPAEPVSRRAMRPAPQAARTSLPATTIPVSAPSTGAVAPDLQPEAAREASEVIPPFPAARRSIGQRVLLPVAATVLVGGFAVVYLWQRSHAPSPQPTPAATSNREAPVTPAPAPPVEQRPVPAVAPAQVSSSTVQLTTDRPVWLRVTLDGQRTLEREVPAGQHLTYTPTAWLVIRAGDAGALRVKVGNGPEEPFGRNAFPLTRRFAANRKPAT